MPECGCTARNISGHREWAGGGVRFVKLGHFDTDFVKNTRERGTAGKHFGDFFLDTLKTTFWMEKLTQRWTQSGPFFQKSGRFF